MLNRLLAVLAVSACAYTAGASTASGQTIADWAFWRNYQCFDTSGGREPVDDDRTLSDRFGSRVVDLDAPEAYCAAVEVRRSATDEDPYLGSDGADLTCYDVDGGQRPDTEIVVDVYRPTTFIGPDSPTEGSPMTLTVEHAKRLCAPTPWGTTSEPTLPESEAEYLDQDEGFNLYYQCYSVTGGRQPSDDDWFVRDWFGHALPGGEEPGRGVDVDQPVQLCAPTNRDGDDRVNLDGAYYLCYDIDGGQRAGFEHFFHNRLTLPWRDQVVLGEAESLCVPSKAQHLPG